jgi:hypothetical protein
MPPLKEEEEAISVTAETHKKVARPNRRQFLKTAAALGTVGALSTLALPASAASAQTEGSDGPAGSWEERVTPTDPSLPSFHVLVTYDSGGGLTADTSLDLDPAFGLSGPIHGVWQLSEDRELRLRNKGFMYDPQGNPNGYVIVTDSLKLDEKGNTYSGSSEAKFYDSNGVLTFSATFKVEGKRITL